MTDNLTDKQNSYTVGNSFGNVKFTTEFYKHLLRVLSSRQGEFHPKPLTEPYVIVSHHTALVVL